MLNDYRRVEWADGGRLAFIVVAAIVLTGWIVRFMGGDPLLLFSSFYEALYIPNFGLSGLELAAVLLIAGAGSSFAAEAGVYNTGAEGQFIGGFFATGLVFSIAGEVTVFLPILVAAIAGTVLMRLFLSPDDEQIKDGQVVRGLLSNFVVLLFLVPVLEMPVKSRFFPLLAKAPHPTSVVFLALALYAASRYVLTHLQFGLSIKAGYVRLSSGGKLFLSLMSGGFCGIAGSALFLCGPELVSGLGFIEGLGTLSFVLAFLTRGRLWGLLAPVSFIYAILVMGWKAELLGNQTIVTGAFSLLLLLSIVPLTMRKVEK
jgi:ABC-type uncharacterized transport system permease subunit